MSARRIQVDPTHPQEEAIDEAASVLASGGLVAFPTETVYGLGADALDAGAVGRIFKAKGRPADNPIIVHIADARDVGLLAAEVPSQALPLIDRWWPGPLTLVLPALDSVPAVTRGGLRTVAVRMPAHKVALALIRASGCPVAAPSANRSGRPSPTTARHVIEDLGASVDLVLDGGPTPVGVESTVLDVTGPVPVLLRPGGVGLEALEAAVGRVIVAGAGPGPADTGEMLARSPGTRYRHYAPRARVVLVDAPADESPARVAEAVRGLWEQGLRVGVMVTSESAPAVPAGAVVRVMGRRADPAGIASNLFAQMRELDEAGLGAIVAEGIGEEGVGRAVMDRLRRAAGVV